MRYEYICLAIVYIMYSTTYNTSTVSGPKTSLIPLHSLHPWQARFFCGEADYFGPVCIPYSSYSSNSLNIYSTQPLMTYWCVFGMFLYCNMQYSTVYISLVASYKNRWKSTSHYFNVILHLFVQWYISTYICSLCDIQYVLSCVYTVQEVQKQSLGSFFTLCFNCSSKN